ncbi:MAG: polysulfide reductase [Candidatus Omnitrophica bacterium CG11_big_fil_rev_8_21_14_0_20_45_26]|uniref:Polysulfide reductase n=1 Tax=Candidatus Abzuiibacterium crystallinum TaxID=1974748 RepID=A0A2H0LQC3_9BACT|nr:MAG: polysulfide reductase [Candidatus Omnitrophica bacterium CG11_big_fil_rev_8_21_14_0_20_45_26]PIW63283.1 MAG: Ni/Fe-hydrogenase cytochrome b subunit [Candidatus Omnitrophica bacterium CG12_big_fil_rev_8_21_14_0_65_45_16]
MKLLGWIFLIGVVTIFFWAACAVAFGRYTQTVKRLCRYTLRIFWLVSLGVLILRFGKGLGAISAMSDKFPWGVWIGLLQSGVALAAGGFVTAATVHIFHIRRFEVILRPMVLTAFLGYLFVAMTLFVEVGRPQRLWHPLVMWQHTSIMFEVAWCVTLYITVLMIEFSPVIFEHLDMPKVVKAIHYGAIPIVIVGVILSTLHQSSMGSMFLVMPEKIYPLWFSPLLPVFFLISAVAVGLCTAIIESFFSHKLFGRSLEIPLLQSLAAAAQIVLLVYFGLKMVDISMRKEWQSMWTVPWLGVSFGIELFGCVLLPIILFSIPAVRLHVRGLVFTSFLVGGGIILNRINVSWFSLIPYTHTTYFPTWMELCVSLFFVTLTVVAFGLAAHHLPVFPKAGGKIPPQTSSEPNLN